METRRKTTARIATLATAWMLVAQVARALDGSEKVPTLPATAAPVPAPISALP